MEFQHFLLGEIDEALDNLDGNLLISMPQNYYMSLGNGLEVPKFIVVLLLKSMELKKLWREIERNITFIMHAIGISRNQLEGWVQEYVNVEGIEGKFWAIDDEDWELGAIEEWFENDFRDMVEMDNHPTHQACGTDCPVVLNAIMARKMQVASDGNE